MFEFDFRNIIVLISLGLHASLLWVLFRYARNTRNGRAYILAVLSVAGWILPMVFYRSGLFGGQVLWARILYMMASFTGPSFFLFTLTYPNNTPVPLYKRLLVSLESIIIAALCFHPTLIIADVISVAHKESVIIFGPLYTVYATHVSLFFLIGLIILFLKRKHTTGTTRKQLTMILLGYFLGSNFAMGTNLILPWLGYFELNWAGQLFSTLLAVFTGYAILRFKWLDIKIITAEGLVLMLNLFLFFQFITSSSTKSFWINGIVHSFVLVFSYFLISSVHKEIEQRHETDRLAHSLEKANIRLKELDQQKTEFLSIASHQLRTPLSIIKGYIELINDGAYGKPTKKLQTVLTNMDESNERLVKLVDEFLDITRIEQGRTKFSFEQSSINELVTGVVKELKDRAKSAGISIRSVRSDEIDTVYMDPEKVRHVVFNYIDNAIKYSADGKEIVVRVEYERNGCTFRVQDQGLGFNTTDHASFFQKFYRGENVKGTNVNGTGLGIYVCRKFIEAHGGHVWAKSDGLGKGSEFGFWIPEKSK